MTPGAELQLSYMQTDPKCDGRDKWELISRRGVVGLCHIWGLPAPWAKVKMEVGLGLAGVRAAAATGGAG